MSGVIPQVAALMGPCAAGTAYIPGARRLRADGQGPRLDGARRAVPRQGRGRRGRHPGGARRVARALPQVGRRRPRGRRRRGVHRARSSSTCRTCPRTARRAAAVGPSPTRSTAMDEDLLDVLPESNRKPYDMYEMIRRIVDDGEWFDMKPQFAKTIITCFARMGGRPVGIVANQPKQLGGILENDSADKAARFINLCDAYGIPLLFLRTCRASWSARRSSRRASSATARRCSTRSRRDRPEDHRRRAQGLRRRLLRDVRQGVRARPDRRLADRRDLA